LLGDPAQNSKTYKDDWECDMLERLRSLSAADRQAVLLLIQDKQRIQQLEQQLSELAKNLPNAICS